MISSKAEYKAYVLADKNALNIGNGRFTWIKQMIAPDYIWKFQKRLRKLEYYKNCRKDILGKI